ncbi:hypothetical protein LTR08_007388 [Meristemomyces frigidus]|nr:hypothetical protein LTR08_007388 [Meristemomyces frigidus]
MADAWETANWKAPHKSATSWQAGVDDIDSFFDSPKPSPHISNELATTEQQPDNVAVPEQTVAAGEPVTVNEQALPANIPAVADPGDEFSTLLQDLEDVCATAEQEQAVLGWEDHALADGGQMLPGLTLSDGGQAQQQELLAPFTYPQLRLTTDEATRLANEQYTQHHALERPQPYPPPASTHLRPTLLPSPIPDIALLSDGTVDAPQRTPSSAGKFSLIGEMRDEEENCDLPIHEQPLPLGASLQDQPLGVPNAEVAVPDLTGHARINISDLLNSASPEAEDSRMQETAALQETKVDRGEDGLGQNGEDAYKGIITGHDAQDTDEFGAEHKEIMRNEWLKRVTMGNLGRTLSSKMLVDVGGMRAEDVEGRNVAKPKPSIPNNKRERRNSSPDPLQVSPPSKRAKLQADTQTGDEASSGNDASSHQKLPAREAEDSHRTNEVTAPDVGAHNTPLVDAASADNSSSPLSHTSDLDAPGSPDELLADSRSHGAATETQAKKPKISQSPRKTRLQRQALEDAKPSAAAKRRSQGK